MKTQQHYSKWQLKHPISASNAILILIFVLMNINLLVAQTIDPNYVDGKIYFKIRDNSELVINDFEKSNQQKINEHDIEAIVLKYGCQRIYRPFKILNTAKMQRTYCIEFTSINSIQSFIKDLKSLKYIEYVERVPMDNIISTPNDLGTNTTPTIIPNQWYLHKIDATSAWNVSTGSSNVIVAVVDNEILQTHEDIQTNLWTNTGEIAGDGIDNDANGYIDDINGFDVADADGNTSGPNSTFDHGTHCAGIAAGRTDNGLGIASISYNIRLMPIKATANSAAGGSLTHGYEGIAYAIANKANIISCSWGSGAYSVTNQNIIDQAFNAGIIVVAAAGNSYTNAPFYPAALNYVISVGATNNTDAKAVFSNYGTTLDVMAPGQDIYSSIGWNGGTTSNTSYGLKSGTSMACPLVAGLCGLMKSYSPNASPTQIESCLKSGCDNIDSQNSSFIGQIGSGRVNALKSLQCFSITPITDFSANITSPCINQLVQFNDLTLGASITSWLWSFGDGGTSTLQNPTHTYTAAGNYTVTLTTTNAFGSDSEIKNSFINVNNCPAIQSTKGQWHMGTNYGINFATGSPVPFNIIPSSSSNPLFRSAEACISTCDNNGNVLFYTDGYNVWDNNNMHIMEQGTTTAAMLSSATSGRTGFFAIDGRRHSAYQGVSIVPNPANPNQYYIFTVGDAHFCYAPTSQYYGVLRYTIIDVALNVALTGKINIPVSSSATPSAFYQTVIPACNGKDYWIITHAFDPNFNSTTHLDNRILAYPVTALGIGEPVVTIGFDLDATLGNLCNNDPIYNYSSIVKASPDGRKVAFVYPTYDAAINRTIIYSFNNANGTFTNLTGTSTGFIVDGGHTGISFSPNSQNLYTLNANRVLSQYHIGNSIPQSTIPSGAVLQLGSSPTNTQSSILQLGPDKRIYSLCGTQFSRINQPDNIMSGNINSNEAQFSSTSIAFPVSGFITALSKTEYVLPNVSDAEITTSIALDFTSLQTNCLTFDFTPVQCYDDAVYDYSWDFGDPASGVNNSSTLQFPSHIFSSDGTYSVILNLYLNGSTSPSLSVTHNIIVQSSTPSVTISGPTNICPGSGASYSVTPVSSNTTYNWTVTGGLFPSYGGGGSTTTTGSNVSVVWGTTPGNYTITVNPVSSCATTAYTLNVTINNNQPTISILPSNPILCFGLGQSVTLTASGANSYIWTPITTDLNCSPYCTSDVVIASPTTTTIYTVIGTDANGCSNTASITVSVAPLPTATVSGGGTVCSGATLPDVSFELTGTPNWDLVYSDGTSNFTITGITTSPFVINNAQAGTYTVASITDGNGCINTGTGTATVTVNPLPTATVSGGGTVCSGATLPDVSFDLTGTPNWDLVYSDGTSNFTITGITTSPFIINNAPAGTYTVASITDGNGCINTGTGTATVTVNPLPTATVSGGGTVCSGATLPDVSFELTGTPNWDLVYSDGISNFTITGITTTPFVISNAAAGTYTIVSITDGNGCTNTGTGTATVTVNPLPTVFVSPSSSTICLGQSTTLTASGTASGYSWSPSTGLNCTTCNTVTVIPTVVGTITYTVTGTGSNGCVAKASVKVTANDCCFAYGDKQFNYINTNTTINTNTVWSGKYYIAPGVKVTVDKVTLDVTNVDIVFGECAGIDFINDANLRATNSVFRSCSELKSWMGLSFSSSRGVVNECIFKNANTAADLLKESQVRFTNNLFLNNAIAIAIANKSYSESITGNTFTIDNTNVNYNSLLCSPKLSADYFAIVTTNVTFEDVIAQNDFVNSEGSNYTIKKYYGIFSIGCINGKISNNNFSNMYRSIDLGASTGFLIDNNKVEVTKTNPNTQHQIRISNQSSGFEVKNNVISYTANTVGKPLSHSAIYIENSKSGLVGENSIKGFETAIQLVNLSSSNIVQNTISGSTVYGIYVKDGDKIDIACNEIKMGLYTQPTPSDIAGIAYFQNNLSPSDREIAIRNNCVFETTHAIYLNADLKSDIPLIVGNYLYTYTKFGVYNYNFSGTIGSAGCSSNQNKAGKNTFTSNNDLGGAAIDIQSNIVLMACGNYGITNFVNVTKQYDNKFNSTASCGNQIGAIKQQLVSAQLCNDNENLFKLTEVNITGERILVPDYENTLLNTESNYYTIVLAALNTLSVNTNAIEQDKLLNTVMFQNKLSVREIQLFKYYYLLSTKRYDDGLTHLSSLTWIDRFEDFMNVERINIQLQKNNLSPVSIDQNNSTVLKSIVSHFNEYSNSASDLLHASEGGYDYNFESVKPITSERLKSESSDGPDRMEIYPNPATDILIINYSVKNPENCLIQITDVIGRVVYTKSLNFNNNKEEMDINDIAQGVYVITLYDGDNSSVVHKLVKE